MRIAPEVEIAVTLATREAIRRRHEYVTVDHLFYALLFDDQVRRVLRHAGGSPTSLRQQLEAYFDDEVATLPEDGEQSPSLSVGFQRVLNRALNQLEGTQRTVP